MARSTRDNDGAARAGPMSPAGRAACFALFVGAGVATLAAVVVLPEYAALTELRGQRDRLAHHLECEKKLVIYNDRLIHAVQTDPVLAARLLMRHGNFRLTGCERVKIETNSSGLPVPAKLKQEAMTPPVRAPDAFCRAGRWLNDSPTKFGLLVLALGAMAVGIVLFGPRGPVHGG